ncbi:MAG TPA: DUF1571 domain-containing protein, partial [Planctomycetaceae bacterium]|nr:DUF1571 domain-containing protein [Planctomycetaceae bacterium]
MYRRPLGRRRNAFFGVSRPEAGRRSEDAGRSRLALARRGSRAYNRPAIRSNGLRLHARVIRRTQAMEWMNEASRPNIDTRKGVVWLAWGLMWGCALAAVSLKPVVAAPPKKHPLDPAIEMAERGLARIEKEIRDYTATLVKRERIGSKLGDYQYMFIKVRHEQKKGDRVVVPFSVYLRFLKPPELRGREV